jgi:hypothetical protein
MTTHTSFRYVLHLAWQAFRLYARHFLPLFLVGGLPMLVYTLALLALGHIAPPRSGLEPGEIFTPALRNFLLWNLPNLLLIQPLSNGALVAAVAQLQRQEPLQLIAALRTALQAWKGLLGALGLFWLITASAFFAIYWTFGRSEPPAWQSLGGLLMIAIVVGFLGYWWFRWTFLTQAVILGGCGPRAAFGHSSRLVAGAWGRVCNLFILVSFLPGFLDNLLGLVGPWAVTVGQSMTAPLSTVGMTLLYWELRGRGEENPEETEGV